MRVFPLVTVVESKKIAEAQAVAEQQAVQAEQEESLPAPEQISEEQADIPPEAPPAGMPGEESQVVGVAPAQPTSWFVMIGQFLKSIFNPLYILIAVNIATLGTILWVVLRGKKK